MARRTMPEGNPLQNFLSCWERLGELGGKNFHGIFENKLVFPKLGGPLSEKLTHLIMVGLGVPTAVRGV